MYPCTFGCLFAPTTYDLGIRRPSATMVLFADFPTSCESGSAVRNPQMAEHKLHSKFARRSSTISSEMESIGKAFNMLQLRQMSVAKPNSIRRMSSIQPNHERRKSFFDHSQIQNPETVSTYQRRFSYAYPDLYDPIKVEQNRQRKLAKAAKRREQSPLPDANEPNSATIVPLPQSNASLRPVTIRFNDLFKFVLTNQGSLPFPVVIPIV